MATNNKLSDLNNHLFNQLDRLANAKKDELDFEIQRSKQLASVSSQIINSHKLVFEVAKAINPNLQRADLPETFLIENGSV